ncbi:hypothetical protein DSECCO2_586220 [anaerobic digester metagenome]|uniref:Uncharacterized protein n=1 Tax=Nitratidesulfovibrio vulgaris (strain DSM 19637 / Miyazaki F) TaxID=883 RepID=B8DLV6_NITV9|nr:hypothetical protein [Nitratidesulfovibrio liaohensis]NHZ47810.1 hypothetical protein [Nitratidesulfovibrio liaohensis]
MNLLPQDVLVMLKLSVARRTRWTYDQLGAALGMSMSMVHSSIRRATQARLYDEHRRRPVRAALEEFLVHGVKYAFPPDIGTVTRGVPTAFAAPALKGEFLHDAGAEAAYVWPHPEGEQRGVSLSPLYKSVPAVALRNARLYEALSLLDAIRIGRVREQQRAAELLKGMLRSDDAPTA